LHKLEKSASISTAEIKSQSNLFNAILLPIPYSPTISPSGISFYISHKSSSPCSPSSISSFSERLSSESDDDDSLLSSELYF
jgi:hypothetical protein